MLPALARPLLEPRLPADLDVSWFASREDAMEMIVDADIAWVDMQKTGTIGEAVAGATHAQMAVHDPGPGSISSNCLRHDSGARA